MNVHWKFNWKRKVISALWCFLFFFGSLAAEEMNQPNIVFILADDLGWGDLSCHGSEFVSTPNIDHLAREGTDFHQFFVANPVCSPSRVAFLTGCYPARFRIGTALGQIPYNQGISQADWLDSAAETLPRILKNNGYRTGIFGKWHLRAGTANDAPLISSYGYDDYGLYDSWSDKKISLQQVWSSAETFIRKNSNRPFFVNISIHETHLAHYPTEESMNENSHLDERRQVYAAVMSDADKGVGRILNLLTELEIVDNTIVIFTSDNGPAPTNPEKLTLRGGYGQAYSLGKTGGRKGGKASLYDGGLNVPFIVRWPGVVPSNRVERDTILSAIDMLPTLCAAAGVEIPEDFSPDGENALSAFKGSVWNRQKALFWDWPVPRSDTATYWATNAVRKGDWKLLSNGSGTRKELYHIGTDFEENVEVSALYPDIVSELYAELLAWKRTLPVALPCEVTSLYRSGDGYSEPEVFIEKETKALVDLDFSIKKLAEFRVEKSTDLTDWRVEEELPPFLGGLEHGSVSFESGDEKAFFRVCETPFVLSSVPLSLFREGGNFELRYNVEDNENCRIWSSEDLNRWHVVEGEPTNGSLRDLSFASEVPKSFFRALKYVDKKTHAVSSVIDFESGDPKLNFLSFVDADYLVEGSIDLINWNHISTVRGSGRRLVIDLSGVNYFFYRVLRFEEPLSLGSLRNTNIEKGTVAKISFISEPGLSYEVRKIVGGNTVFLSEISPEDDPVLIDRNSSPATGYSVVPKRYCP